MNRFFVAVQRFARRWHIHWMRFHHRTGANVYTQCRCGKRGWYPLSGGYSALDRRWLDASNDKGNRTPECGHGGIEMKDNIGAMKEDDNANVQAVGCETPGYVPFAGLNMEESKEFTRILKLHIGGLSQAEFDYFHFLNKRVLDELLKRCL